MSRIEEALEKAARLRSGTGSGASGAKNPGTVPYSVPLTSCYQMDGASVTIDSPLLVTVTDPHSPPAEEYRKFKSMLVSLTRQDEFRNTIMITSSVSGEGKSVTSLNLAISLAQEFDHTVLLIDADLRKPSLHRYFNLKPEIGLADCLQDGVDLGDALIKTGIGKLSLLPAGKAVQNPAELFSSQRMSDLLQEVKHRYPDRYVLIDTPPALLFAETLSLSYLVDGVVFLVREGKVTMQNISDSLAILKGTTLLGMIYNDVNQETTDSRYKYYYHYYDKPAGSGGAAATKGFFGRLFGR